MPIATVAQLKALIPGYSGTADDAALAVELARAEAELSRLCGWPVADDGSQGFTSATYTLYLDGPMRSQPRMLRLPLRAVQSVTSAHASITDTYDSTTLIASTSYTITDTGLWLVASSPSSWSTVPRGNKVVCVAGWNEGDAPGDVTAAVLAQAKHRWMMLRVGQGVVSMTAGGSAQGRPTAIDTISSVARDAIMSSAAFRWDAACG